jgi:hypothetical protein
MDPRTRCALLARLPRSRAAQWQPARILVRSAWLECQHAPRIFRGLSHRGRELRVSRVATSGMSRLRIRRAGWCNAAPAPCARTGKPAARNICLHPLAHAPASAIRLLRGSNSCDGPSSFHARLAAGKIRTLFAQFLHRDLRVAGAQRPSAQTADRINTALASGASPSATPHSTAVSACDACWRFAACEAIAQSNFRRVTL